MLKRTKPSPRCCLWRMERSCCCRLSPWSEPQLSAVLACCCFQATLPCYSHSIPRAPGLPVLRSASPCVICCPIHKLLFKKKKKIINFLFRGGKGEAAAAGTLALISRGEKKIKILKKSTKRSSGVDGTGSGHRGNSKTALEMVGCEVVGDDRDAT